LSSKENPDLNRLAKIVIDEILSSDKDRVNIEEYCRRKLEETCVGLSVLQIADMLPSFVEKTINHFKRIDKDKRSRTIKPDYELAELPPNTLFRYEANGLSYARRHRKEILNAICEMNWRSFEFLCAHLLNTNKITKSGVSRGTKEGGIDFYGLLEMRLFSTMVFLKGAKIRIIGQAKRYTNKVNHKEVRVFRTHKDDLLAKKGNAAKKLPPWFVESGFPVLSILMITTKFTKGAKKFAEENGIVLIDGEQVVEDLTKSKNVREWFSRKNGTLAFDKVAFIRFFEKQKESYQPNS